MRTLLLTEAQWDQLEHIARSDPKPYKRERAAALLKIAAGATPARVASSGLLVSRSEDTMYRWIDRFEREGIASLDIKPGRGRKPAFSPCGTQQGAGAPGSVTYRAPRSAPAGRVHQPLDAGRDSAGVPLAGTLE